MIDPSGPERVPLDEIVLVEPRTSWVALVREREGRRTTFPLRLKYADRKRLLWELAVRVPDALERSLGPKSAATPPVGSAAREAAPAARRDTAAGRPQLPPADHRAPATQPDTSRALDGLDRAMAGLGSSLVAAPARNPAPPASSLGCGLFVAPLRDDDDA